MAKILSAEEIREMDEGDVHELIRRLNADLARRSRDGFAESVRELLNEKGHVERDAAPVVVLWPSDEYDDGWYYDEDSGVAIYPDRTVVPFDVSGTAVADALTEFSGEQNLTERSVLWLDLRTGEVEHRQMRHFPQPS